MTLNMFTIRFILYFNLLNTDRLEQVYYRVRGCKANLTHKKTSFQFSHCEFFIYIYMLQHSNILSYGEYTLSRYGMPELVVPIVMSLVKD